MNRELRVLSAVLLTFGVGVARAEVPPPLTAEHVLELVDADAPSELLPDLPPAEATRLVEELALLSADRQRRPRLELAMRSLGDRAVPGLIRSRRASPPVSRWALGQLDAMNRKVPGDCVQTKDADLLVEILRAFGGIRDPDALGVVLSFINTDRDRVRAAAREATLAYGSDAAPKLREVYASLSGKPAPPDWGAGEIAQALFAAEDGLRLEDVNALVDAGFESAKADQFDRAVADFDRALARQPELPGRADMAPAYVQYALAIEASDPAAARSALRKAAMLAPDGLRAAQAKSEMAYLEAEDLKSRGVTDIDLYRRAAELDPTNARARAEIGRIEGEAVARQLRLRRMTEAAALAALVIAGLVLFAGRRRRR